MAFIWMALLCALPLGSIVGAEPVMSIDLSTVYYDGDMVDWYSYTIHFDVNPFDKFQSCLCNLKAESCYAHFNKISIDTYNVTWVADEEVDTTDTYNVTWVADEDTAQWSQYNMNVSKCSVTFSDGYIACNKIEEDNFSGTDTSTRVFSISSYVCPACVSVTWSSLYRVDSVRNDSGRGVNAYKGFCVSPTSSTATQTSIKENASFQSDDNTSIVIGVAVTLLIVVIIVVILVVIFWQKKRNSKPPTPFNSKVNLVWTMT